MGMGDLNLCQILAEVFIEPLQSSFDMKSNYNLKEDKNCGKKLKMIQRNMKKR